MRLILISNRLPFHIKKVGKSSIVSSSIGGVATGLSSFLDQKKTTDKSFKFIWVGSPGDINPKEKIVLDKIYEPVYIPANQMENFYQGFCNKTIWPLFHYFPALTVFQDDFWNDYKKVNKIYCDKLTKLIHTGDMIWIHDYHLLLLPNMLRQLFPDLNIAFFLHIPFPSFELFRLLPSSWRKEILEGMIGSDLIGFHTYEYTQHFLNSIQRILGLDHTLGEFQINERLIRVDTFPMGIEFEKFASFDYSPKKNSGTDIKTILSIDRLDYTKGILNRVKGFELFLKSYPEFQKKVRLHLIAVPSRIDIEHYQDIKRNLDETIGRINGNFGTTDWTPILYQYKTLEFTEMVKTYRDCDIALITPLRDGMNLISKEFLAARTDDTGVLIISEMTGASKELPGAIIINPNSISEITSAIHLAITMPLSEQIFKNKHMRQYLKNFDVIRWGNDMLKGLEIAKNKKNLFDNLKLTNSVKSKIKDSFIKAKNRLILLDYDGTLVPYSEYVEKSVPDNKLINLLKRISSYNNTLVFIVSDRDRSTLDKWFTEPSLGLIAEHGALIKMPNQNKWQFLKTIDISWKQKILTILQHHQDRVPGSFIEEKEYSISWHYRNAEGDKELAQTRAKELFDNLIRFTSNIDIQIIQGNKVIEVRNKDINKGAAALSVVSLPLHDFILAIGDDLTDEDMFKALPDYTFTIMVGYTKSAAKYFVNSHHTVLKILNELVLK